MEWEIIFTLFLIIVSNRRFPDVINSIGLAIYREIDCYGTSKFNPGLNQDHDF